MTDVRHHALRTAVRAFFREFANVDFASISEKKIEQLLAAHRLTIEDVRSLYSTKPLAFGKARI